MTDTSVGFSKRQSPHHFRLLFLSHDCCFQPACQLFLGSPSVPLALPCSSVGSYSPSQSRASTNTPFLHIRSAQNWRKPFERSKKSPVSKNEVVMSLWRTRSRCLVANAFEQQECKRNEILTGAAANCHHWKCHSYQILSNSSYVILHFIIHTYEIRIGIFQGAVIRSTAHLVFQLRQQFVAAVACWVYEEISFYTTSINEQRKASGCLSLTLLVRLSKDRCPCFKQRLSVVFRVNFIKIFVNSL